MKVFKFIFKNVLFPASFFYMIFDLIVYTIDYFQTVNDLEAGATPKLVQLLLIFAYFIIIALSNNIFKTEMSLIGKVAIHYFSILIPLMGYCAFKGNNNALPLVFFVITIIYALIATPVILVNKISKRKRNEETRYDRQFK